MRLSRTYAASRLELWPLAVAVGDVVDDADAVTEPVGAAPLDGLPDRRKPERLARVDGEVGVLALEVLEGVEVPGGWVSRLRAGDVEADHPGVAVADRELGDLHAARLVTHGGQQHADADAEVTAAVGEALEHGLDDLLQRQPARPVAAHAARVLFGGVADLGVHDPVARQVLGALVRDPGQRLGGLHHADGVVEGLQVALQRAGVGRLGEPGAQVVRVGGGQPVVARLTGEFGDGRRAEPPSR